MENLKIFSQQRQDISRWFTSGTLQLILSLFQAHLERLKQMDGETGGYLIFLIHCFSESLELSCKMCRLRKIGKDLFKDFSVCSLMFQDASGMTAHMSLFLCGALHIQKQSKVNSFCVNERAAVRGPKISVSFSSRAAELGNSLKMYSPKISIRTFPNI